MPAGEALQTKTALAHIDVRQIVHARINADDTMHWRVKADDTMNIAMANERSEYRKMPDLSLTDSKQLDGRHSFVLLDGRCDHSVKSEKENEQQNLTRSSNGCL